MPVQTLFNCPIVSFDCSLGWNSDIGSLRVVVVEDPANNQFFQPQEIGTPIFFSYDNWTYAGILRSWQRVESASQLSYDIEIASPTEIVQNVELIVGEYAGPVTIKNLFNIYGHYESAYGFGSSLYNDNGIPLHIVKAAFADLENNPSAFGGAIELMGHQYYIDWGDLPQVSRDYRVRGPNINLLEMIDIVCTDIQHDYFFRLINSGGKYRIKLHTISRKSSVDLGKINEFIQNTTAASKASGRELRNDITSTFVVGDRINYLNEYYGPFTLMNDLSFISRVTRSKEYLLKKGVVITSESVCEESNVLDPLFSTNGLKTNRDNEIDAHWGGKLNTEIVQIYDASIWPYWGKDGDGIFYRGLVSQSKSLLQFLDARKDGKSVADAITIGIEYIPENRNAGLVDFVIRNFTAKAQSNYKFYFETDKKNFQYTPTKQSPNTGFYSILNAISWYGENHVIPHRAIPQYGSYVWLPPEAQGASWERTIRFNSYNCTVGELQSALVSQDAWMQYLLAKHALCRILHMPDDYFNRYIHLGLPVVAPKLSSIFSMLASVTPPARIAQNMDRRMIARREEEIKLNAQRIYEHIRHLAEECYGRKFLVKLPTVTVNLDTFKRTEIYSDDPADSGYTENSQVLGLYLLDYFKDENGKLKCFAKFDSVDLIDLGSLQGVNYTVVNDVIVDEDGRQSQIQAEFYYGDLRDKKRALLKKKKEDANGSEGNISDVTTDQVPMHDVPDIRSFGIGAALYIESTVEPDLSWDSITYNTDANGEVISVTYHNPRAVIVLPQPVYIKDGTAVELASTDSNGKTIITKKVFGLDQFSKTLQDSGKPPEEIQALKEELGNKWLNSFDTIRFALVPVGVAVGLTSNTNRYGPWTSTGAAGKVQYTQEDTLNPWTFGSFADMDSAGIAKATESSSLLQIAETGTLELPGSPTLLAGDPLISGGPNISNVNFSIGANGTTTTYAIQNFGPKFGSLSRLQQEKLLRAGEVRTRARERSLEKKIQSLSVFKGNRPIADQPGSAHEMIFGRVNDSGSGASVFTQTLYETANQLSGSNGGRNYIDYGGVSWDGILTPFAAVGSGITGSKLPYYSVPHPSTSGASATTLNPYKEGHTVEYVVRDRQLPEDLKIADDPNATYTSQRPLALRAPVVLAGWGYDTNDRPVPAGSGTNQFADDYLTNRRSWKVGPLDARWDDTRGIWTTGGASQSTTFYSGLTLDDFSYLASNNLTASGATNSGRVSLTDVGTVVATTSLNHPICAGSRVLVAKTVYPDSPTAVYDIVNAEFLPVNVVTGVTFENGELTVCHRTIFTPAAFTTETCQNQLQ